MKENKKLKLKNLNFYIIDENYINYLSQFDKHIAYNKDQTRPYVGVVIVVESHYYFAPLFSPKLKHKSYKDNLTFFKISKLFIKCDFFSNMLKKYIIEITFTIIPKNANIVVFLSSRKNSFTFSIIYLHLFFYLIYHNIANLSM